MCWYRRVVSTEEGEAFAEENGLLFFEASAMTGESVEHVSKPVQALVVLLRD
jgi:hypothetical protein